MAVTTCSLDTFLDALEFGTPRRVQNLLMVPLALRDTSLEHPGRYLLLPVALAEEKIRVTETGSVSRLHVESLTDQPVFAPAGAYLRGGGQDRILAVSVVIAPHARGEVPVQCGERHRWNAPAGTHFHSPEHGAIASSALFTGSASVSQEATWDTVNDIAASTRTESETDRHGDSFEQTEDTRAGFRNGLVLDAEDSRTIGVIFCVHSASNRQAHWALDIFGRNDLFQAFFAHVRDSAALTALAWGRRESRHESDPSVHVGYRSLLDVVAKTLLHEELVPVSSGVLRTGQSPVRADVAVLEESGAPLHILLRWTP